MNLALQRELWRQGIEAGEVSPIQARLTGNARAKAMRLFWHMHEASAPDAKLLRAIQEYVTCAGHDTLPLLGAGRIVESFQRRYDRWSVNVFTLIRALEFLGFMRHGDKWYPPIPTSTVFSNYWWLPETDDDRINCRSPSYIGVRCVAQLLDVCVGTVYDLDYDGRLCARGNCIGPHRGYRRYRTSYDRPTWNFIEVYTRLLREKGVI